GQRMAHAPLVEPCEKGRGPGSTERGTDAFSAAVSRTDVVWAQRHQEAAAQIVAECYGAQKLLSRPILALGHGQGRGHDCAARMCFGHRLEIVGLVRVREPTGSQ